MEKVQKAIGSISEHPRRTASSRNAVEQKDLSANIPSACLEQRLSRSAVQRKRAKPQGVGGKPTNVKTIVKKSNGGMMRKNHRGCGAVMADRRKRTKYS